MTHKQSIDTNYNFSIQFRMGLIKAKCISIAIHLSLQLFRFNNKLKQAHSVSPRQLHIVHTHARTRARTATRLYTCSCTDNSSSSCWWKLNGPISARLFWQFGFAEDLWSWVLQSDWFGEKRGKINLASTLSESIQN